jgi:hypothetical protein
MQRDFRNYRDEDLDCTSRFVKHSRRSFTVRNPAKAFAHELARRANRSHGPSRRAVTVTFRCRGGRIIRKKCTAAHPKLTAWFHRDLSVRANGQWFSFTGPFHFVVDLNEA